MNADQLLERLIKADEEASLIYEGEKILVPIAGGANIILSGYGRTVSHDIDILGVIPELVDILEKYDMNTRIQAHLTLLPYNYEDRLIPVNIPTKVFDYRLLSPEDQLILKLDSDRDKDVEDRENPLFVAKINWEKLENIATHEIYVWDGQRERFDRNYEKYKEKFHKQ